MAAQHKASAVASLVSVETHRNEAARIKRIQETEEKSEAEADFEQWVANRVA